MTRQIGSFNKHLETVVKASRRKTMPLLSASPHVLYQGSLIGRDRLMTMEELGKRRLPAVDFAKDLIPSLERELLASARFNSNDSAHLDLQPILAVLAVREPSQGVFPGFRKAVGSLFRKALAIFDRNVHGILRCK